MQRSKRVNVHSSIKIIITIIIIYKFILSLKESDGVFQHCQKYFPYIG